MSSTSSLSLSSPRSRVILYESSWKPFTSCGCPSPEQVSSPIPIWRPGTRGESTSRTEFDSLRFGGRLPSSCNEWFCLHSSCLWIANGVDTYLGLTLTTIYGELIESSVKVLNSLLVHGSSTDSGYLYFIVKYFKSPRNYPLITVQNRVIPAILAVSFRGKLASLFSFDNSM